MLLSEYIKHLQSVYEEHGDSLELIYSKDSEGNNFSKLNYAPSLCHYNEDDEETYFDEDQIEEENLKVNAICLN